MGSCSNSCVQLQKEDIEHLRCKLSRLKKAGALYETGSDWMLLVLCDNGFVFKQLCSAPEGGHRTCKLSRLKKAMTFGVVFKQRCSAQEGGHRTPEM